MMTTVGASDHKEACMEKTWNDAAGRWLNGRTTKWIKQETHYVEVLTGYLATLPLSRITKGVVADLRDDMLKTRSVATVNRYLTVLRSILNMARDEWEWIDTAPKIKRMEEPSRVRFIEKDEARRLLRELPSHLKDKVVFALSTGLRDANVRELRWDEVDLQNKMVTISGGKMKNGKPLSIPLNETAYEVLAKRCRDKKKDPEWVFAYAGKPVHRSNTKAFRKALRRAGIENFRWHDLRHTWASWHIQKGTHTAAVREMGGWSDDRMVQRYAHLSTKHLRKVADNIGSL
jgi:integrase